MCDVKWIKIATDIFDDEKILLIESLPEADAVLVVWFKLLCLAGKMNNGGVFEMANGLAYNAKMLATIFRQKEATINLALQTFEQFGMIQIIDGVILITNWGRHQSIVKKNDYMRDYMRDYRAKQKQLSAPSVENADDGKCKTNVNINVNTNVRANVKDKNKNKKENKNKNKNKDNIDYESFVEQYNEICVSLPRVQTITQARKSAIRARISEYPVQVIIDVFRKAENSDFLSGRKSGWRANFDWLMKPANFAKVIEGNYDGKTQAAGMDDLDGLF